MVAANARIRLGKVRATRSVCSLPRSQPNSGLPEFGHSIDWPKSDKSDFGWRVGEGVVRTNLDVCPLPVPPPQAGEGTMWRGSVGTRRGTRSFRLGRPTPQFGLMLASRITLPHFSV